MEMPEEYKGKKSKKSEFTDTSPRKWTEKEIEWMKQKRSEGYSLTDIAKAMDRSEVSVSVKFKRLGKRANTYNAKHIDDKYAANDAFLEMICPSTVLDIYCGNGYWRNKIAQGVTSNDINPELHSDYHEKSELLIHKLYYEGRKYDIVDLDPYGSAYDCFDCAIKMAKKGIIITFGELGHKRFKRLDFVRSHYGISTLEDFTTENLIKEVVRIGLNNKKQLTPVIIREWNRISRVYFKIEKLKVFEQWHLKKSQDESVCDTEMLTLF